MSWSEQRQGTLFMVISPTARDDPLSLQDQIPKWPEDQGLKPRPSPYRETWIGIRPTANEQQRGLHKQRVLLDHTRCTEMQMVHIAAGKLGFSAGSSNSVPWKQLRGWSQS